MRRTLGRTLGALALMLAVCVPAWAESDAVGLDQALSSLGAELSWDSVSSSGVLSRGDRSISFAAGGSFALFGQAQKEEIPCPDYRDGRLLFPSAFVDAARDYFQKPEESKGFRVAAIIIDPGHGGKDPGADRTMGGRAPDPLGLKDQSGRPLTEKSINLSIGLLLRDRLARAFPDKKVLMTRSTDTYLELEERTDIANSVKLGKGEAIIYISVHTNSSLSKKAKGYEVWYLDPDVRRQVLSPGSVSDPSLRPILNDLLQDEFIAESVSLAQCILDSFDEQVGKGTENRGIKARDWYVVKHSNMPAVLVEVGYISNDQEARSLADQSYLKKISDGIYNGAVSFIRNFER